MSQKVTAAITAIQGYLPDFVLSNAVLETMVDTNDAWITERTGIKERRILKGKDQGMSVMAVEAVKGLCAKRGIDPMETFLNKIPTAEYLPWLFRADGLCEGATDSLMGLAIPQWSAVWFVVLTVLLAFVLVRKPRP